MSILSYPDRGEWGKSSWRGNCSGYVYRDLFERLKPKTFVDPMVGSGTSVEVAKSMGITAWGLDLHQGFNILRDSILNKVGREVDVCISHPPYHDMIVYSGEVWGTQAHPDDLSRCVDLEDFHIKLQIALMNQRTATLPGGYFGTIIGDQRKDGKYCSMQAEAIARMPASELAAVLIKQQHNVQSSSKTYGRMKFPMIMHEYVLIWQRREQTTISMLASIAKQAQARLTGTWKSVVRQCLIEAGGKAELSEIYPIVEKNAPQKAANNPHFREKIRQILQTHPDQFKRSERGVWALA
jgi:hypothetical protein